MNYIAVDAETGEAIAPETTVEDFRGKAWIFESVARTPSDGKSGRVLLRDPEASPESYFHHREFFPSVINAEIKLQEA